jgi:Fe-S-cluster containining protein
MNYGELFSMDDNNSALRKALLKKVIEELKDQNLDESILSKVPEFVNQHITNGVPEYMLIDFLEGSGPNPGAKKTTLDYCADCRDAPCCTQNDPIAVSYDDVKRLAKGFRKSSKYVIKKYLIHYNPMEVPSITHKIKKARPCQWLSKSKSKDKDKDNKCTVYDSRPNVCRIYPLSLRLAKSPAGRIELAAGVSSYCNVAFNMMKFGVERMVIRENFKIAHPEEYAVLESTAASILPTQKGLEAMGQMDRARLLRTANEIFFNGLAKWLEETNTVFDYAENINERLELRKEA